MEVDEADLDELKSRPGADLVNFERRRVKPWTVFDFAAGWDFVRKERVSVRAQIDVQNITGRQVAYNFGNPFSGTHFGHPRLWGARLKFVFR